MFADDVDIVDRDTYFTVYVLFKSLVAKSFIEKFEKHTRARFDDRLLNWGIYNKNS
jgi:hypothetical protein